MTVDRVRGRLGRVGVWLGALGWAAAADTRAAAAEIDDLGYGALWLGEAHSGKEIFSNIGLVLAATRRLVVASGIANIWVRDATAMNAGAIALAEAYPGRFLLGLGVSHPPQLAPRGLEYRRPVATMSAYLDEMDAVGYEGPRPDEPVPRVLAALRPPMLELARDKSGGAHPYFVPPEHTARAREILGPERLLAPEQAVLLETDPTAARARAREHMGWYLTLPNYAENLRWLGFDDDDFAESHQRPAGGRDRRVGRRGGYPGARAGASRRRRRPRLPSSPSNRIADWGSTSCGRSRRSS